VSDELIDDTPAAPYIRRSQKYPGLVSLSWEDSERLVRQAESGHNPRVDVYPARAGTALERRVQSIGVYKLPRKPGWVHGVRPRQTQHGADWGVILGLAVLFGAAILFLAFLGSM
jgi:hypothetical protein